MEQLAQDLAGVQETLLTENTRQWVYNPKTLRITREKAPLYKGADERSGVISTVPEGLVARVLDKTDAWYAVELSDGRDPPRTGWINADSVVPVAFGPHPLAGVSPVDAAVRKINALIEAYKNNPYVRITGFSVDISTSPSITVEFEPK
jgi:hypothetical protein